MSASYDDAIHRFLAWLAVACLIAAISVGPVMVFIWFTAAYALTRQKRRFANSLTSKTSVYKSRCHRSRAQQKKRITK